MLCHHAAASASDRKESTRCCCYSSTLWSASAFCLSPPVHIIYGPCFSSILLCVLFCHPSGEVPMDNNNTNNSNNIVDKSFHSEHWQKTSRAELRRKNSAEQKDSLGLGSRRLDSLNGVWSHCSSMLILFVKTRCAASTVLHHHHHHHQQHSILSLL